MQFPPSCKTIIHLQLYLTGNPASLPLKMNSDNYLYPNRPQNTTYLTQFIARYSYYIQKIGKRPHSVVIGVNGFTYVSYVQFINKPRQHWTLLLVLQISGCTPQVYAKVKDIIQQNTLCHTILKKHKKNSILSEAKVLFSCIHL